MKFYKCQSCEFIFRYTEKKICDINSAGVCPKCYYSLTDHDAELNNLETKANENENILIDVKNPNYFECTNCLKLNHISHKVKRKWFVLGIHKYHTHKHKYLGTCDKCIYQLYFCSLVIYFILFSLFFLAYKTLISAFTLHNCSITRAAFSVWLFVQKPISAGLLAVSNKIYSASFFCNCLATAAPARVGRNN